MMFNPSNVKKSPGNSLNLCPKEPEMQPRGVAGWCFCQEGTTANASQQKKMHFPSQAPFEAVL